MSEGEREHSYDTFRGWDSEREREGEGDGEGENEREVAGRERASGGWIMFLSEIIKISPPFPVIY